MTNDYMHRGSIGREAQCRGVSRSLSAEMSALYDSEAIRGYLLSFIANPDDAIEQMIPSDCLQITAGRFPFLYLRLNLVEGHPQNPAIEAITKAAGFENLR